MRHSHNIHVSINHPQTHPHAYTNVRKYHYTTALTLGGSVHSAKQSNPRAENLNQVRRSNRHNRVYKPLKVKRKLIIRVERETEIPRYRLFVVHTPAIRPQTTHIHIHFHFHRTVPSIAIRDKHAQQCVICFRSPRHDTTSLRSDSPTFRRFVWLFCYVAWAFLWGFV